MGFQAIDRLGRAGAGSPLLPAASVVFTVFAWASAFPLIRIALREIPPLELAAARFAVAALLVAAWLLAARPSWPSLRDLARFLLCGSIGIALYNACLNAGQRSVTAAAASFIVGCVPMITALLAAIFLGERLTRWGLLGGALSLVGIAVIASTQEGGLSFSADATLVVGAAMAQATYFIVLRPLVPRYGALTCTAYTLLAGSIFLLSWLPGAVGELAEPASPAILISVVALGVLPGALGYASWTYAVGCLGAARAANFLYLVPPVAATLGFLLAGERPAATTIAGGAIALAGVVLVNLKGRPKGDPGTALGLPGRSSIADEALKRAGPDVGRSPLSVLRVRARAVWQGRP